MSAWAVALALRVSRARFALARMASPLAVVVTAVEHLATDGVASLLLAAASDLERRFAAEAVELGLAAARLAGTLVAFALALVKTAVQHLSTALPARELGPGGVGARHLPLFSAAVARDGDFDAARRAAAGVAQ